MRLKAFVVPVLWVILSAVTLPAAPADEPQSAPVAPPAPTRDAGALLAVSQAVGALGGSTVAQIADCIVYGTIQPINNSSARAGNFVWKTSGAEFHREFSDGTATQILVSGHGHPSLSENGKTSRLLRHVAQAIPPLYLPALVLAGQANDPRYTLTFLGPAAASGQAAIRLHTSLDSDAVSALVTPQEWYLDATTGLPLRVEYRVPDSLDAGKWEVGAVDFSDYRRVAGVSVPFRMLVYEDLQPTSVVTLTSVTFNTGLSPADFDAPTGGAQ